MLHGVTPTRWQTQPTIVATILLSTLIHRRLFHGRGTGQCGQGRIQDMCRLSSGRVHPDILPALNLIGISDIIVIEVIVMKKIDRSDLVGVTKGIYTYIRDVDGKLSLFKCELCGDEYQVQFHRWYHKGRKNCECTFKNTHHKLYGRYEKMLARCYNEHVENYKYYGGRGIKVCHSWGNSFQNFLDDMEASYFEGAELDRIDNNKDYSPDNCRWVTHSQNMLNRKGFKNKTNFPGVRHTPQDNYIGRVQINKKEYRTKRYKTAEEAYQALQKLKQRLYSEMNIE